MDEYIPLVIVRVDAESSGFPTRPGGPYEVWLTLSRAPSKAEIASIRTAWGTVVEMGASGFGQIGLRFENQSLIVQNASIDLIQKHERRLRNALQVADDAGRQDHETAVKRDEDRAAHVAELRRVGDALGW